MIEYNFLSLNFLLLFVISIFCIIETILAIGVDMSSKEQPSPIKRMLVLVALFNIGIGICFFTNQIVLNHFTITDQLAKCFLGCYFTGIGIMILCCLKSPEEKFRRCTKGKIGFLISLVILNVVPLWILAFVLIIISSVLHPLLPLILPIIMVWCIIICSIFVRKAYTKMQIKKFLRRLTACGVVITIVLIIITAAIFYLWSVTIFLGKAAPEITASCERYSDDYVIVLNSVEFGASVKTMKYFIVNDQVAEDYSNYSGSDGLCTNDVDEIYGVDLTFQNEDGNPISNVSFYDDDLDGRVSTGDFFVIRGINNNDIYNNKGERVPGVGREGLVFNLEFVPTGETICNIILSDTAPTPNKTIPKTSNRFTINPATVPKTPDLNISTSEPVSSASPSLESNSIMIAATVCNNDSVTVSNISVRFFDDGEEFYSEGNISIDAGNELRVLTSPYYLGETGTHNITVKVTVPEWGTPIQANVTITVICAPPSIVQSFEINPFSVLFTVLIASLLSAIRIKRHGRHQ